MIDHERFSLAQQTVTMGKSPAFTDMLDGLKADSEELEKLAMNSSVSAFDRRNAFFEWSAHRRVIKAMEETIENATRDVASFEEEMNIERANERERAGRANWTSN